MIILVKKKNNVYIACNVLQCSGSGGHFWRAASLWTDELNLLELLSVIYSDNVQSEPPVTAMHCAIMLTG